MFASAHIEVHVLPVFRCFGRHEALVVVRVHVAEVVCRRACEARHGVEFEWEDGLAVDECLVHNLAFSLVPCPHLGASEWRFARLCGFVGLYFGQAEG